VPEYDPAVEVEGLKVQQTKITITKQQAAAVQLETAIKLFFENRDLVSAFTLTAAADGILEGIWQNERDEHIERRARDGRTIRGTLSEEWNARLNPDVPKGEGFSYLYKHQNFFKHADRDHDQNIEFRSFELTALRIFIAIGSYYLIYDQHTKPMTMFFGWYAAYNPSILGEGNALLDYMQQNPFDASNFTDEELAAEGYRLLRMNCPELFTREV
jgi:hypothetical protein